MSSDRPRSARRRRPSAGPASASPSPGPPRSGQRPHGLAATAEVLEDHGDERAIGGDHGVGGGGARADRLPERPVRPHFQLCAAGVGRAELLEALRVEDERRQRGIASPGGGIAQDAGAQPVHEIHAVLAREPRRKASGAPAEQRVGRVAVQDRRPSPAGAGERHVGDRQDLDVRRQRRVHQGAVGGWTRPRGPGRRRHDERHRHVAPGEMVDEIGHMSLQAPPAVPGRHGTRRDRHPQARLTHEARPCPRSVPDTAVRRDRRRACSRRWRRHGRARRLRGEPAARNPTRGDPRRGPTGQA